MPGEVQDIRIKFVSETSGLKAAEAGLRNLTAVEREAVKDFQQMNQTSAAAFKTAQQGAQGAARSLSQVGAAGKDAAGKLKDVGKEAKGSLEGIGGSLGGLKGALSGVAAGLLGAFALDSLASAGQKIIDITSEFQKYRAVLTNVLGSQEAADIALQQIQKTAAKTNFSVTEITGSFVKLANANLKPTQNELINLIDLANSSGKSIDDLTEAVLDANTFEFERLKEFGIKARKEGDQIEFTFKGQKQVIDRTSEAVNDYILSLGQLPGVAGSTAAISATLGGQISNLGDSFDQLFATIGEGSGGALSYFVEVLGDAVTGITRFIKGSEQLRKEAELAAKGAAIEGVGSRVEDVAKVLAKNTKVYATEQEARAASLKAEAGILETARIRLSAEYGRLNEIFLAEKKRAAAGNPLANPLDDTQVKIAQRNLGEVAEAYRLNASERKELGRLLLEQSKKEAEAEQVALGLVEKLQQRIKELGAAQSKSFSVAEVKQYGRELEATKKELEELLNIQERVASQDVGTIEQAKLAPIEIPPPKLDSFRDQINKDFLETLPDVVSQSNAIIEELNRRRELAEKERLDRQLGNIQSFYDVSNTLAEAFFQIQDAKNEERAQGIEENRNRELKLVGDNEQAKAFINNKFDAQDRALKTKQAKQERDKALFEIALNTAIAIAKAIAISPLTFGLPFSLFAAAQGALQAGLVLSKPVPKFKKGTKSVPGWQTGRDSVLAMLQPEEGVMPVARMKTHGPAFNAIFDGTVPGDVMNKFVMDYTKGNRQPEASPDYHALLGEQRKTNRLLEAQQKQPIFDIKLNKKGFETYLRKGDSTTEILNNIFPK